MTSLRRFEEELIRIGERSQRCDPQVSTQILIRVKDLRKGFGYSAGMKSIEPLHLDVCPILASGRDPFAEIMSARESLKPGQSFVLTAPFEPLPLYDLFRNQGFEVDARSNEGVWEITFSPTDAEVAGSGQVLDLRDVDPPGPLQQALEAASMLGRDETLVIHTRFRPVFLLEQLEERGFEAESMEEGSENWETHIWRITA